MSEAPLVDYIKSDPTTIGPLTVDGETGYVLFYPLSFNDLSQGSTDKGLGPIKDTIDISLFDHAWCLTPSARLATANELTAAGIQGNACGDYAQTTSASAAFGPFVIGNGSWVCDVANIQTATRTDTTVIPTATYPVIPITISGFTSRPAPITFADSTANATSEPQISAGQIVFWLTEDEVNDEVSSTSNPYPIGTGNSAEFFNALIEEDSTTALDFDSVIVDATANGTSGGTSNGNPTNNMVSSVFGTTSGSGNTPGFSTGHDIHWAARELALIQNEQFVANDAGVFIGYDYLRQFELPGSERGQRLGFDFGTNGDDRYIGSVSRGQVLSLEANVAAAGVTEANEQFIAMHQVLL